MMMNPSMANSKQRSERHLFGSLPLWCVLCCLLMWVSASQAASMQAEVNRTVVAAGESLTLTVIADGIQGQPDLQPLAADFDVLGTSTRREVQIINGEMLDLQSWDIELMPKRLGNLVIPPLQLKGVASQPLAVQVVKQDNRGQSGAEQDVFIEVDVDQTSPFVNSQSVYTVRFYSAVRIAEAELSEPASDVLTVRRLGEDTGYFQQRSGRQYRVIERRYALFPRQSGRIEVPAITLQLSVPDSNDRNAGFFGRVKRVTLRSDVLELDVKARPDAASEQGSGSAWWLPASSLELQAAWEGQASEFRVGVPITRVLELTAIAVTGEQLPELSAPEVRGLKIYTDKPEVVEQPVAGSLTARRTDKWAVIPQTAGVIELPAVSVTWFDTENETYKTASVPTQMITVLPAAAASEDQNQDPVTPGQTAQQDSLTQSASSAAQQPLDVQSQQVTANAATAQVVAAEQATVDSQSAGALKLWKRIAAAAMLAWLLTLVIAALLWRGMRQRAAQQRSALNESAGTELDEMAARASAEASVSQLRQLLAGTANPESIQLSKILLQWGAALWPKQPPRSLQSLAQRLKQDSNANHTQLRSILQAVDRSLYGSQDDASKAPENTEWEKLPQLLQVATTRESERLETSSKPGSLITRWLRLDAPPASNRELPEL